MAVACDADAIFRVFTACPHDVKTLIVDVRQSKHHKRLHINQSYNIRLASDGKALVDQCQSKYEVTWSQGAWWGKNVIVYGDADLKRDHPVIERLAKEKQCRSLLYYKDGFESFHAKMPFLCTTSVKASSIKRYPSQIIPNVLYLGDWSHAEAVQDLNDLNVKRVITIHNHPENLKLPGKFKQLRLELPDVESADISQYFNQVYEFVEEGRAQAEGVLVHCGAGVSRSATLAMMYLMRKNRWSAAKARTEVTERRSLVCINDGFWRALCALEGPLGVIERSDVTDTTTGIYQGDDVTPAKISKDAAGEKVQVNMMSISDLKRTRASGTEDERDGKRPKHSTPIVQGGALLRFEVAKPEGVLGELRLGPMSHNQQVMFGRVPSCDVVLEHLSISRQHAIISVDASGCVYVTDLQSGHGTKLDEVWIKPKTPRQLRIGSVIHFGASTRSYKYLGLEKGM
ncbi:hypothetical protein CEUSTIGMA_g3430.t1 [Chlamydomonas eustigma]|uniref:protein-tyrosine-phosphatase n=1 Tax=Chlamydomonas eustigma TaxID=1157962 RepID=A0A250WYR9_9CHLO|nr:hypothetical protein CEUSTIGMA_g3430.t1 [Chlamydomonas eustigma]|eukprot:GAX75987.1 hypothetical protein CEUSTIGMA_g3430.t1 [Chlamydomonas eustigma]